MPFVDDFKSWSTQRILNRFPRWSRARDRSDSVARFLISPGGRFLDELLEEMTRANFNYFVSTVDVREEAFLYHLNLPKTFVFDLRGKVEGVFNYEKPTITGVIDSVSYAIEVPDQRTLLQISKKESAPTRIVASQIASSFNNLVIPETAIIALDSVSINDENLDEIGTLVVKVDNGVVFGERCSL